jgi:hypothetical protein
LETHGTLFHGKRLSVELIVRVLACLAEGLGIRATARVFEVDPNTVLQWLVEAAEQFHTFSAYFRLLPTFGDVGRGLGYLVHLYGETRTANHERRPYVPASTTPADQRRTTPYPMSRCAPGIVTIEDPPTAAVWTTRLRGLGC